MKIYLSVLLLISLVLDCKSQVSEAVSPKSFDLKFSNTYDRVKKNLIQLPELDNNQELVKAKEIKNLNCKTCRNEYYGKSINVDIDIKRDGTLFETNEGNIWILHISSSTARGLQFYFNEFLLPSGAMLHIYSEQSGFIMGAFTSNNNNISEKLATAIFPENVATLEYFEPKANYSGKIAIKNIVHVFKQMDFNDSLGGNSENKITRDGEIGFKSSGSCTVDVNCPVGSTVSNEALGIALISNYDDRTGYASLCTGFLINSTAENDFKKPYLLTAAHCLDQYTPGYYFDLVFYFNYQNAACDDDFINPLTRAYSFSGATLRSMGDEHLTGGKSDYGLLELTENPKNYVQVAYLGWDSRAIAQSGTVYNISHPLGDSKKVTISNNSPTLVSTLVAPNVNVNFYAWQVNWNVGVTQPVSSGSPLLNNTKRVIGTLYGGISRCADSPGEAPNGSTSAFTGPDWFGRFDYAWNNPNPSHQALRHYLDEAGTGSVFMDTYVPPPPPIIVPPSSTCRQVEGDSKGIRLSLSDEKNKGFGWDVSIDDEYVIVGAPLERKAYIYKIEDCEVTFNAVLEVEGSGSNFAKSVGISGDYAIVGDYSETNGGNAYIFKRADNEWQQVNTLSSFQSGKTWFGFDVAISENYAMVSSPKEDNERGMLYIFKKQSDGTWGYNFRHLSPFGINDDFGYSIEIEGERAVVGAPGIDNSFPGGIVIYKLEQVGPTLIWNFDQIITATGSSSANFGFDVSISDNDIISLDQWHSNVYSFKFGSNGWTSNGVVLAQTSSYPYSLRSVSVKNGRAIVGDLTNDPVYHGKVHYFEKNNSGNWIYKRQVQTDDRKMPGMYFGWSSAMADEYFIVGAWERGINSPGHCLFSGSAYVYNFHTLNLVEDQVICNGQFSGKIVLDANNISLGGSTSCSVIYNSSSTTIYTADQSITLRPGFWAKSGSTFIAKMAVCSSFSNPPDNGRIRYHNDPFQEVDFSEVSTNLDFEIYAPEDFEVTVFPNPSESGDFQIRSYLGEIQDVKIFDSRGNLVESIALSVPEKHISVNISAENSGLFIVKMIVSNKLVTRKVLIR